MYDVARVLIYIWHLMLNAEINFSNYQSYIEFYGINKICILITLTIASHVTSSICMTVSLKFTISGLK